MKSRTLCSLLFATCLACLGLGSAGCGGTSSGYVPVDSPLVTYEPPAKEDLVADDDADADADVVDDWGGDGDSDDDDDATDEAGDDAAAPGASPGN